ncbi:MAG TPA: SH3 domain-containing protein [Christensenellaceae bacterium]|nr:SH3 domain-containing protein [Christensenellaceae bacterium]
MYNRRYGLGMSIKYTICWLILAAMFIPILSVFATEADTFGTTTAKVKLRQYPNTKSSTIWYDELPAGWVAKILGTEQSDGATWYHVETNLHRDRATIQKGYILGDFFRELSSQEKAAWLKSKDQDTWQEGLKPATETPSGYTTPPGATNTPNPYPSSEDGPGSSYVTGFVLLTKAKVNLRDAVEGSSMGQLDKGTRLPYYGVELPKGKYKWIYVLDTQSNQYGYIRNDCYTFVDEKGEKTEGPGWQTPAPNKPDGPITSGSYAMCTVAAANLTITPNSYALTAVPANAVVKLLGVETSGWYPVSYNSFSGYMKKEHLRLMTGAEIAEYLSSGGAAPATATPPPATDGLGDGYVKINAAKVNLRNRPNGSHILQMEKGSILPYYGAPQFAGGANWLYVYYPPANVYGYVHEDFYNYTDYTGNPVPSDKPAPTNTIQPGIYTGYVKLTLPGVNLRVTPGGASQTRLSKGLILPYSGVEQYYGGYKWVFVVDPASKLTGYVRSDCYIFTDSSGNQVPAPDGSSPYPETTTPPEYQPQNEMGKLSLIKGAVNIRVTPGGKILGRLDKGTEMSYYLIEVYGGYTWYQVFSPIGMGYVRSDMTNIKVPPNPSDPGTTGISGYLITTKSNVNLRNLPGGKSLLQLPRGKVYPIVGPIVDQGGYNWTFVRAEGHTGYLRSDCVRHLTQNEINNYLNGIMPNIQAPSTPSYEASGHIITLQDFVNIRVSPSLDAQKLGQVNKGVVLPYYNAVSSGGNTWYYVDYAGTKAYVMAPYVRIMSLAEYQEYINTHPGGTATPAKTPEPGELSNIAVTLMDRVKLRKEGNMSSSTATIVYRKGTRVTLTGSTASKDGYNWYSASVSGVSGWIRADMIRILSKTEAGDSSGSAPTLPDDKPTATYRTLRLGSQGDDVSRLQQMLKALGVYSGNINGIYDSATEKAVREYQKLSGLHVDGVAGQKTQDKLYDTQAPDPYDGGSTVDATLYPVEIVDWYKGDIQTVWGKGEVAVITDVRTGLSFRAKRWAGGYHSDAEPLTAADTEVFCRIYGVERAQEISEKDYWQRRPLWVTIKGRTFAASMYGVPHNYPAGDTIPNNNFNGQFCVHFWNSRTHSSNKVDQDHMKAIQEAYDKAPAKK